MNAERLALPDPERGTRAGRRRSRRRALDNPARPHGRGAAARSPLLVGLFWLSDRTTRIAPRSLTDVLLYTLLAVDLALLLALVFVLARNLLKLWVEQRQAAPFARFRAQARRRRCSR